MVQLQNFSEQLFYRTPGMWFFMSTEKKIKIYPKWSSPRFMKNWCTKFFWFFEQFDWNIFLEKFCFDVFGPKVPKYGSEQSFESVMKNQCFQFFWLLGGIYSNMKSQIDLNEVAQNEISSVLSIIYASIFSDLLHEVTTA